MTFEKKLEAAISLLESTGIWRSNYAPPFIRLLCRLGLRIPPPHFMRFIENVALTCGLFGVGWVVLTWITLGSSTSASLVPAVIAAVVIGLLFGVPMAAYYRHGARKHGIPLWKDFKPVVSDLSRT